MAKLVGVRSPTARVSLFCTMARASVFKQVGLLDHALAADGMLEAADLGNKAVQAGIMLLVVCRSI